jgi:hypothetical protein
MGVLPKDQQEHLVPVPGSFIVMWYMVLTFPEGETKD